MHRIDWQNVRFRGTVSFIFACFRCMFLQFLPVEDLSSAAIKLILWHRKLRTQVDYLHSFPNKSHRVYSLRLVYVGGVKDGVDRELESVVSLVT